jgi:hypothetical protein
MLVSKEQFEAFVHAKSNRFPFSELKITDTNVYCRWMVLKSPIQRNIQQLHFPLLATSLSCDLTTYLIVTNQAIPYTGAMSDVMDDMWRYGFMANMPRWYHDVVKLMEHFLDVYDSYHLKTSQRHALFFLTIKNEVEFRIKEAFKSVERGAGCVLLADWTTWFHATGYASEKSFLQVACLSFQFVSNKISFISNVDGDCDGDSSQASYGSEGDRVLHDYYVEMAEVTKTDDVLYAYYVERAGMAEMDDGCGSEDDGCGSGSEDDGCGSEHTTVSDCTIHY